MAFSRTGSCFGVCERGPLARGRGSAWIAGFPPRNNMRSSGSCVTLGVRTSSSRITTITIAKCEISTMRKISGRDARVSLVCNAPSLKFEERSPIRRTG